MSKMTIHINNLQVMTIIGMNPIEREELQLIIINCKVVYNYSDNKFLDYSLIRDYLINTIQNKKFYKLEDAILCITHGIKMHFPIIHKIKIEIKKPHIFKDCHVSLKHTRWFKKCQKSQ